jgi:dipeptidyl aminopeptidase/acylaminoacyl peptidase
MIRLRNGAVALTLLWTAAAMTSAAIAAPAVQRSEQGNLVIENVPAIPAKLAERTQQYQQTRAASLQGWLPGDQGMLIATRFGETAQIHRVASPGGARTQLTFFAEPIAGAAPRPDGSGFLYIRDVGGNEFYQLYWFDFASGHSRLLSDGKSRNSNGLWSHNGRHFAYSSTLRNGRDSDVRIGSPDGSSRGFTEAQGTWSPIAWSPDDRLLLVGRYLSINESELYVADVERGRLTRFHPRETKISYSTAVFAPDGRGLYYVSDEDSDFLRLRYEDLDGGHARVLTADTDWDVDQLAIADDGRHLAWTVNEDGIGRLHVLALPDHREIALPPLPAGVLSQLEFDRDGRRLGLVVNGARTPGDVFAIELAGAQLTRWTASETGGLDAAKFVEPQLVHFDSFDGRSIPAFYYPAPGAGPHPVLIDIHGGPESQALPGFNPIRQYYVGEMGISVLVPNVRGSAGYGKAYLQLDDGMRREDSVRDIGALLDWIAKQPELDADRVATMGGSYGGFMALASQIAYDARLRGSIDVVGISNFATFLGNTQEYRRDLRRAEYGDERDPAMRAFLERISPTTNAARISKPMFIVQGANDPRVPASEAEAIVARIRSNGGDAWYLLAKDEGHGFRKKSNRDYYSNAVVLFLQQHLLPPAR